MVNKRGIGLVDVVAYCICVGFLSFLLSFFFVSDAGAVNTYGAQGIFAELMQQPISIGTWGEFTVTDGTRWGSGWLGKNLSYGTLTDAAEKLVPFMNGAAKCWPYVATALTAYQVWVIAGCPGYPAGCQMYVAPDLHPVGSSPSCPPGSNYCDGGNNTGNDAMGATSWNLNQVDDLESSDAACVNWYNSFACPQGHTCGAGGSGCAGMGNGWGSNWCHEGKRDMTSGLYHWCLYDPTAHLIPHSQTHTWSDAELANALLQAVNAGNTQAMNFVVAALNAMDAAKRSQLLDDALLNGAWQNLMNALVNALTAGDKTALDNLLNQTPQPSPPQKPGPGTQPGFPTNPQIQEDVRQGVDQAITDQGTGSVTDTSLSLTIPGAPAPPTPPEKENLPGILDTFKGSLTSLPLLSWLDDQMPSVSSGSPILVLAVPEWLGGDISVDFSEYEGTLTFMGNCLLALVGLGWTMFLLKGRGD